ncbi:hypothetical protein, partial [Vibrio parahaemolyticus]|uniref:hypothetical protein n=1 Tax=Vibrio parahaemolyticus TaxID=670 RepID=UPI001C610DCF
HVVGQVIDRVRVVVLAKFFHDISEDVGTSQFSVLCIIGFIFYIDSIVLFARKLRMVVFLFLAFLTVLPALLQKRFEPTY